MREMPCRLIYSVHSKIHTIILATLHNNMKINSDKSKEMLICVMQDPEFRSNVPIFIIDGNEIDNVQYAKLLGVAISSDLTWNKHVDHKAEKRVYMHAIAIKKSRNRPT